MLITMMMAVTVDGKIAKNEKHFANWTSKEDKQEFIKTSKEYGLILMGKKTFATFPSPLKNRLNVVFGEKNDLPEQENVKWVSGDVKKIIAELEAEGFDKALLCGGAYLNTQFLQEKLIDEIIITIEPKLFGEGISLFGGDFNVNLELKELKKINDNSILISYKVIK